MGRDKALVDFGGQPLALVVADRLRACSDDVFVVAKQELGFPVILDDSELETPLAGILTALRAAKHELVFVCACDMPFVSADLVLELASEIGTHDAVVAVRRGTMEPLHAIWSLDAISRIADLVGEGERAVHRVLEKLDTVRVDVAIAERSFENVNTPDDLRRVLGS